jgi:hypothetical protein
VRATTLMLATLLLAASAHAQTPAPAPEAALHAFLAAVAQARWSDAAERIDLDAYDRWRAEQLRMARLPRRPWRVTAEELMRADTLMPRAVAEYQALRANERRDDDDRPHVLRMHADVPTLDSLERLPVRAAAARWLRAKDRRWIAEEAIAHARRRGCTLDTASARIFREQVLPDTHVVIGSFVRDSLAFVVTQELLRDPGEFGRDQDDRALPPRVVRMRRDRGRWVLADWEGWFSGRGAFDAIVGCEARGTGSRR